MKIVEYNLLIIYIHQKINFEIKIKFKKKKNI